MNRIVVKSKADDPNSGTGKTLTIVKSTQKSPFVFGTLASIVSPMVFDGSAYRSHHTLSGS